MRFQTEYMRKYNTSPDKFNTQNIEYRHRKDYVNEPALQTKKRVPSHVRESIKLSDGHTLQSEQFKQYEERKKIDSLEKNIFNYRQQHYNDMKAENERKHANDEFVVLGNQDKLASNNIAYSLRKPTATIVVEQPQQQQQQPKVEQQIDVEATLKQVENEKVKHANEYDYVILGPNNTNQNSAVIYKLKNKVHNRRQPHKIIKSPTKLNTNKIRRSVKLQQQQAPVVVNSLVHSCGSQTDLKPAPTVDVDTGAVKIKKDIVPIRIVPMTEYQKSFMWKENVASKVDAAAAAAPVVSASVDNVKTQTVVQQQQPPAPAPAPAPKVVLNDQRPAVASSSVAIQPTVAASADFDVKSRTYVPVKKRDPIHRTSEYKSNFVTFSKPKSQTTKKNEEAVVEHYDSDSEEAKRKVLYISNPNKPFGPHGNLRRWKSEYQTSFKAFCKFDEDKLKAEAAARALEQANRESEWFKNIVELRRKAEEYKIRSYGVNFSSDHLGQLVGRNLELWDVESKSDKQDEREKQQKIVEFVQRKVVESPEKRKPKTRSRSVEAPVIVEAYEQVENKQQTKKQAPKIESNNSQQQQQQPQAPQYGVLNKSEPIVRLMNNLSSTQIKNSMQWDSQSDYSDYELRLRNELNTKNSKELIENHAALLDKAKKRLDEEQQQQRQRLTETSSDSQQQQQQQEFSHDHHYHHHHQQIQVNQDVPSHRICSVCARRPKTTIGVVDTKQQPAKSKMTSQKLHQIEDYLATSNNDNREDGYVIVPTKYKSNHHHHHHHHQQQPAVVKEAFVNENDDENFQFKTSLNLQQHANKGHHHEPLRTINENFGQTYIKPRKDVDTDSLSQLSTRSLASSSSLLERAKGNRDKFWGTKN